MKSFTPKEERVLRILAVNCRESEMRAYLGRAFLPFLAGEARLAGLIILRRSDREIREEASRFSLEAAAQIAKYSTSILLEAGIALEELDSRVTRRSYTVPVLAS